MLKQYKKVSLIGIVLLFWVANLYAVDPDTFWTKTYGGAEDDIGYSVQRTTDDGFIIVGSTSSFGAGQEDVYLIKTDNYGDTVWTKTFGDNESDIGRSVWQTTDEGYIIAGYTRSFGADGYDVYLIKTDAQGNIQWYNLYGGTDDDEGFSVQQTLDKGYIIAGRTKSLGNPYDIYVIKTDSLGIVQGTKTFGGASGDWAYSIQQTSDNGYIVAGYTASFGGAGQVYLIKTNAIGDTMWTRNYGGTSIDIGNAVQETSDNGFIITGFRNADVYLIKTDANGIVEWDYTYGGFEDDEGRSVTQTIDNGYVVAGYSDWPSQAYILKTDDLGNEVWTKTYGGINDDEAWSIQEIAEDDYIIAGLTSSGSTGNDVYLIRLGYPSEIRVTPDTLEFYVDSPINVIDSMRVRNQGIGALVVDSIIPDEDWIVSMIPNNFEVPPGNNYQDVEVEIDATGLPNGVYYATLSIYSNDPNDPVYAEPVKLTVDIPGIEEETENTPNKTLLYPISPNPIKSYANVRFALPNRSRVSIKVYNVLGQQVNTILEKTLNNGEYEILWNGDDKRGNRISSGIYFIQLETEQRILSQRVIIF